MPVFSSRITAKQATASAVSALLVGKHHTDSSALHNIYYRGPLMQWSNFRRAVESTFNAEKWSRRVLKYAQALDEEVVELGDEHGLQGRFQQSFGTMLGHIFKFQGIDIIFADFKSLGSPYSGIPDAIMKDKDNGLKVVGELKSPWIKEHQLSRLYKHEQLLRRIIAQPVEYMMDLRCKYGFISTYNETIFLRQEYVNGEWVIDYSPPIDRSSSHVRSDPANVLESTVVSVKQCFLYVAKLASAQGPVQNNTPKFLWITS